MSSPDRNDQKEQRDHGDTPVKQTSVTDPKAVPKSRTSKIDFLPGGNAASYVSQRSSSVETLDTPNEVECHESGLQSNRRSEVGGVIEDSENKDDGLVHNCETMPPTMFHPEHQSTPNQFRYRNFSDGSNLNTPSDLSEEHDVEDYRVLSESQILMPGDLLVPIMGFETMEARSKFTVYKIQVQIGGDSTGWFVFRRYSDFVHLNERLKRLFPGFRLALPPKRWFRDNFDKEFLEERVLGLQAFLNNITGHKDICNSTPVRNFFCLDEPPGPHDSLEESRALCDTLEETLYALRQELREKESEISLLKEELDLYRAQVEMLSSRLRDRNTNLTRGESLVSPTSVGCSLAECDRHRDSIPSTPCFEDESNKNK